MSRWIEPARGALPLLNAITTDRHLVHSLRAGDWVMGGFDLSALALGLAFALWAWRARMDFAPALAT
ncbi:hypothetical protein [Comamonas antarctica]|uniref:Uncharacterized protein n=1 Tax=Comamonas antarctica TaxID=2743470 RepID=A0A6N1X2J9_9BURK|nr:hypothetical protein [Comamonas antarctica]QKV51960.1 hypothetical protein HUK68_03060 [Comamonas antarctica]